MQFNRRVCRCPIALSESGIVGLGIRLLGLPLAQWDCTVRAMSLEKLKSPAELAAIRERMGRAGKPARFHQWLLRSAACRATCATCRQARALGDALLVAVNGDASVRALKGPTRPINTEEDRAEVLAALECVDYVTIFHTERVTDLVRDDPPAGLCEGRRLHDRVAGPGERAALESGGGGDPHPPAGAGQIDHRDNREMAKLKTGRSRFGQRLELPRHRRCDRSRGARCRSGDRAFSDVENAGILELARERGYPRGICAAGTLQDEAGAGERSSASWRC